MARNFVQPGAIITFAAPYDRLAGQGALLGSLLGVATSNVLTAALGEFATAGVWELEKRPDQEWFPGVKIYWDDQNQRCDALSTFRTLIGTAVEFAANPSTTGVVRLNGSSSSTSDAPDPSIANLIGGESLGQVIAKVNTILGALRSQGIIAP